MICDEVAQHVSALCDGQTIPPTAAQHIAKCPDCEARLSDYLALGVELRRAASFELANTVPARTWTKPRNRFASFWQKGLINMKVPRFAFAALIIAFLALGLIVAVDKARAHNAGTVVLLSTAGPTGILSDCPLSTVDKNQATCAGLGSIGVQLLGYKIQLVSRDGERVLLAIRTRTYPILPGGAKSFSPFELDSDPAKEIWFEPGEPQKLDLPGVGSLTFNGEWMDHMPMLGLRKEDLSPGPNELRFASPLLLKDKAEVVDLVGSVSGTVSTDDPGWAVQVYIPTEGRFLISLLPMEDAVEAKVFFSRISFDEGGHAWEFVTGAPISRADKIWVLHQPDFRMTGVNSPTVGNMKLVRNQAGGWIPQDMNK